jgi:hypothetical protein
MRRRRSKREPEITRWGNQYRNMEKGAARIAFVCQGVGAKE